MIRYVSTRAGGPALSFEDVLMTGLAPDGGLYLPDRLPRLSPPEIAALAGLPYAELALHLLLPFVEGSIPPADFRDLVQASYAGFRHKAVAPLKQLDETHFLLELFHGPTLAFKDFALQLLARLLEYVLARRGGMITIIGATSGDTGSAAIEACRGRENMRIFILYPEGRVSDVQRRQMTGVADANVHAVAVQGTFDDCQDIVKTLFADEAFRAAQRLTAVNSINWARILAQIVYYFYAGLALGSPSRPISFSVPTGNFGDIYAGYLARAMGLPVEKLIIATNQNDILTRTLADGAYAMQGVEPSLSPSMDIQISSNFERLLFDLSDRDGDRVREMMQAFRRDRHLPLDPITLSRLRHDFAAARIDDAATLAAIKEVYATTGELLDPHTAVGVMAARACHATPHIPCVTLATAHPAKFPEAIRRATGEAAPLPPHMHDLFTRPERTTCLRADAESVKTFIQDHP